MKKKMNTTYMVELAVLIAIILIMAFTPIGFGLSDWRLP